MLRNYNIIKSILSEPWLLSQEEAMRLGYALSGVFSPTLAFEPLRAEDMARASTAVSVPRADSPESDTVGVVNISGVLYKYDSLCDYGMETYGNLIRNFANDPRISAIILNIDSPGGSVVGTEELGNIIAACSKPTIAFVSDMCCSGAFWLACHCDEIIANNTTATVGSIGVMCSYTDVQEYYHKQGIVVREIYAPQSSDKNEESRQLQNGKDDLTKARLQVLAAKFISIVRHNRPGVSDEQLTGKVFYAKDVVGSLVDSIMPFEAAVERAAQLGASASETANFNSENMAKNKFPALAAAAGVEAFESADGTITLQAEQAEAVEAALSGIHEKGNEELSERLEKMSARLAELESRPGDAPAVVAPATDGHADEPTGARSMADAWNKAREFAVNMNE